MSKIRLAAAVFAALFALFSISGVAQAEGAPLAGQDAGAVAAAAPASTDTRASSDDLARAKSKCIDKTYGYVKVVCWVNPQAKHIQITIYFKGVIVAKLVVKFGERKCYGDWCVKTSDPYYDYGGKSYIVITVTVKAAVLFNEKCYYSNY